MGRILRREAAKRDLIQQWVWYAENAGFEVADRFLAAVEDALTALASQPGSGSLLFTQRSDLRGIRRVPVGDGFGNVLLFYFPLAAADSLKGGVDLVRVLHGSRDLKRIFETGV